MDDLAEKRFASCLLALKEVFGFPSFRPFQEPIIRGVCEGRDQFVVAPTGQGKSLLYCIPALVLRGTTVVISPLISLSTDQTDKLVEKGVSACRLNGDIAPEEEAHILTNLGEYDLVFISPERASSKDFREACRRIRLAYIVLDEAHLSYEAGMDFRPSYSLLSAFVSEHPKAIRLACTATAGTDTETEVMRVMQLREPQRHIGSPWRENLKWKVVREADVTDVINLVEEFQGKEGAQIVYASSRRVVESLAEDLSAAGLSAAPYHAGMPGDVRKLTQQRFISGGLRCVVATSAFGMGVDVSAIRLVANYHLPDSLFSLLQQSGRGGRDGLDSVAWVNVSKESERTQRFFINCANPPLHVYTRLWNFIAKNGDAGVRVNQEVLRRVAGVPDGLSGQLDAALAFLSYHGAITNAPAGTAYRFPVRNKFVAERICKQFRCKIREGIIHYEAAPDAKDNSAEILKSGAGWPAPALPVSMLKCATTNCPITSDMLLLKKEKAEEAFDQLREFCWSQDKKAFVEAAFVQA